MKFSVILVAVLALTVADSQFSEIENEPPPEGVLTDKLASEQDEDEAAVQDLDDPLSENNRVLAELLARTQDDNGDNQVLSDILAAAQDGDLDEHVLEQLAQSEDTGEEQGPAKAQWSWWRRRYRHYNNYQRKYYNYFTRVARNYMRHTYNNKRHYERTFQKHIDRSYQNMIAKMNSVFKDLFTKIKNYVPKYVGSKDAKEVLKDVGNGGKKVQNKALVIEEPSTSTKKKTSSKKPPSSKKPKKG